MTLNGAMPLLQGHAIIDIFIHDTIRYDSVVFNVQLKADG